MFGRTVVHGIDLFLRALDRSAQHVGPFALRSLKVTFATPLRTGEEVWIEVGEPAADQRTISVVSQRKMILTGTVVCYEQPGPTSSTTLPRSPDAVRCRELTFEQAAEATGEVPLAVDPVLAAELYPALARRLPADQLAVILATTRIVGMECPGLHSVYTGLELSFDAPPRPSEPVLRYRVVKSDRRFKLLSLAVEGPGVSGTIGAMLRPTPVEQVGMHDIVSRVPAGKFAGRKACVIGGSRGLGETAAKILAAGGADVCITYARGPADAERVLADIRRAGAAGCGAMQFDVLQPRSERPAEMPPEWQPDSVYFFASPWIGMDAGAPWNPALFQSYCEYYVTGLSRSLAAIDSMFDTSGQPLTLFWPSTVFLEKPAAGAAEYAAAKGAGEVYCSYLAASRRGLTVHTPRLPRMLTDQTAGVRAASLPSVLDVLLETLP